MKGDELKLASSQPCIYAGRRVVTRAETANCNLQTALPAQNTNPFNSHCNRINCDVSLSGFSFGFTHLGFYCVCGIFSFFASAVCSSSAAAAAGGCVLGERMECWDVYEMRWDEMRSVNGRILMVHARVGWIRHFVAGLSFLHIIPYSIYFTLFFVFLIVFFCLNGIRYTVPTTVRVIQIDLVLGFSFYSIMIWSKTLKHSTVYGHILT